MNGPRVQAHLARARVMLSCDCDCDCECECEWKTVCRHTGRRMLSLGAAAASDVPAHLGSDLGERSAATAKCGQRCHQIGEIGSLSSLAAAKQTNPIDCAADSSGVLSIMIPIGPSGGRRSHRHAEAGRTHLFDSARRQNRTGKQRTGTAPRVFALHLFAAAALRQQTSAATRRLMSHSKHNIHPN